MRLALEKKTSESVGAAGRPGPADPADPTMGLHLEHKSRNVTHLCFDLIFKYGPIPVSQKTIDFATQVRAIAVVFLVAPEILSSYHCFLLNSS